MKLYEEILFLKHYYGKRGKWVVENVNPYYTPLIKPTATIGRHLFWANFEIANIPVPQANCRKGRQEISEVHGIDISGYDFDTRKDQLLRNCVQPELGLHVFNESNRVGLFQF